MAGSRREKGVAGESLKLVIKLTVSDPQASQETVVEEDKNLFATWMIHLINAKATESVRVKGVIMCILGALKKSNELISGHLGS